MDNTYSSDTVGSKIASRQLGGIGILQLSEDVKTKSIEKTLLPLLNQVTSLALYRKWLVNKYKSK